ncbi:galanin peptides-like [Scleropages formosus]|uniref:Galanin peptides n=2 Tax=Scleropages formosus TaxID=113540 RepID=A0A0P7XMF6_SCLFO|nr:galanin peptides-like [Scleropages formosus]
MDLSRNSTRTEEAYSARGCPERRVTGVQSGTTFPPEITFLTVKSCDHCKSLNLSFGFAKRLMDFNKALSAIDERTVKLARILDDKHSKELDSGIQEGESIQPEEGEPEKDAYQAELGPPSGSQSKTSLGSTQGDAEMEKPTAQKRDTKKQKTHKMQKSIGVLCVFLLLCAALSETIGLVIAAKEKRGWTLNSAGYLLGPHAIDSHRTLSDKQGFGGKRDLPMEEDFKSGPLRIADENVIHTIIDFLSYLKLKEMGALDNLSSSLTSDETAQP